MGKKTSFLSFHLPILYDFHEQTNTRIRIWVMTYEDPDLQQMVLVDSLGRYAWLVCYLAECLH